MYINDNLLGKYTRKRKKTLHMFSRPIDSLSQEFNSMNHVIYREVQHNDIETIL